MFTLIKKLKHKFSRLFSNPPISSSPQVGPNSKEGESLSSFFSHLIPLACFGGSMTSNHQVEDFDWDDHLLDKYVDFGLLFNNKNLLLKYKIDDEDEASRKSIINSKVFEEVNEQHSLYTPKKTPLNLTDDSYFISPMLNEFFESCLPNIVKGCKRVLLYSTLKHGISLRTLIHKSTQLSSPALLIVGDMQGAVFGGLLDCPLKPTTKRKYQGTNQTFVFTTVYGQPRLFRPTGVNRYYYLCSSDLLALGGGGSFALCLDGDLLTGTSGPCDTFGNLCLAHGPEFELKNVELWGFTHASPYLKL